MGLIETAIDESFRTPDPRKMIKNPVMFVTLSGATLTVISIFTVVSDRGFVLQLALWLWFTVLFANFAEAMVEGRGKAQANTLRKARKETVARLLKDGGDLPVPTASLQKGDLVVCEPDDVIPVSGGDRSAVTGGTRAHSIRQGPRGGEGDRFGKRCGRLRHQALFPLPKSSPGWRRSNGARKHRTNRS